MFREKVELGMHQEGGGGRNRDCSKARNSMKKKKKRWRRSGLLGATFTNFGSEK